MAAMERSSSEGLLATKGGGLAGLGPRHRSAWGGRGGRGWAEAGAARKVAGVGPPGVHCTHCAGGLGLLWDAARFPPLDSRAALGGLTQLSYILFIDSLCFPSPRRAPNIIYPRSGAAAPRPPSLVFSRLRSSSAGLVPARPRRIPLGTSRSCCSCMPHVVLVGDVPRLPCSRASPGRSRCHIDQ